MIYRCPLYEDALPPDYPYDEMFPHSIVECVRMFPEADPIIVVYRVQYSTGISYLCDEKSDAVQDVTAFLDTPESVGENFSIQVFEMRLSDFNARPNFEEIVNENR